MAVLCVIYSDMKVLGNTESLDEMSTEEGFKGLESLENTAFYWKFENSLGIVLLVLKM